MTDTLHIAQPEQVNFYQVYLPETGRPEKFILFLPFAAPGGGREGVQRLYVEAAQHLLADGFAALLIDVPPYGESYYTASVPLPESEFTLYETAIHQALNWLEKEYAPAEVIVAGMCLSALPLLYYVAGSRINRAILFSPHNYWNGEIPVPAQQCIAGIPQRLQTRETPLNLLLVFGEKDVHRETVHNQLVNKLLVAQTQLQVYIEPESNYTFYGWRFKQNIIHRLQRWLQYNDE